MRFRLSASSKLSLTIFVVAFLAFAVYGLNHGIYIGSVTIQTSSNNSDPNKGRFYQKYCRYLYVNGTLFRPALNGRKDIPDAVPDANGQLAFDDVFVKRPGEFEMNGVCRIFRE